MELFHSNMSVCAQKVRLVLHEKNLRPIEHAMVLRDGDVHRPEYLKLNPKGVVPTLVDQGTPIVESTIICEYLDEAYPLPSLMPRDPIERAEVRQWMILPDAGLHRACGTLTTSVAIREQMIAYGRAQLTNRTADNPLPNDELVSAIENGLNNPLLPTAVKRFDAIIAKMSQALSYRGPWLCGDSYTLADISMLPYVSRLEHLSMSWFWDGDRSKVGVWLERAKARPNYCGISEYLNDEFLALFAERGRDASPRIQNMLVN